ncbi:MAG: bifunctional oligoribonuclease/PAP phosphatase NrnA [Desulfovermiculus sp.]
MDRLLAILEYWQKTSSFLLLAHINPDGDAVGSLYGLAHLLAAWDKKGNILLPDNMPDRFSWLEPPWPVVSSIPTGDNPCVVVLDCADLDRVGHELAGQLHDRDLVNIDHHTGNSLFGNLNWVDPGLSSVGEMIALFARKLGFSLRDSLAEALYLAIMSDTGSLSYSNTSPQTLDIVSEILALGLDVNSFQAKAQRQNRLQTLYLHGRAMQDVSLRAEGKIGIIRATRDMLEQTGASQEDCDGLIDYVRTLRGVVVAVSLRDVNDGVKFSLRTWGEVNVQTIAAELGGGGHPNAAGGLIDSDLVEAEERIVETITAYVE